MPGLTVENNDIVRVRLVTHQVDQVGINVLHFKCINDFFGGMSLSDFAIQMDNFLAPLWKPVMTAHATYRGIAVANLLPIPTAEIIRTGNVGPGSVAGDALPLTLSGLVSGRGLFAGPANRARVYVPFPGEASNDATGKPTSGYVADLQTLASDIQGDPILTAGTDQVQMRWVIYHRGPKTSTDILAATASEKWASQHRRGDFGKTNPLPF